MHAGDVSTHDSFDRFRSGVLANRLTVNPDEVVYHFGPAANRIAATVFDVDDPAGFTLSTVNGKPVDLHPSTTWPRPYLNGEFGSDRTSVTVGPVKQVLDFALNAKINE